jgi:hypothetical protein
VLPYIQGRVINERLCMQRKEKKARVFLGMTVNIRRDKRKENRWIINEKSLSVVEQGQEQL